MDNSRQLDAGSTVRLRSHCFDSTVESRQEIGLIYQSFFSHSTYRNFLMLLLLYFFILPFLRTECHYTDKLLYSCKMVPLQQWKLPLNIYVTNAYNLKFWFSGTNFKLTWQGDEMKFLSQLKVLTFLIPVSVSDKLLERKFILKTWKSMNSDACLCTLVLMWVHRKTGPNFFCRGIYFNQHLGSNTRKIFLYYSTVSILRQKETTIYLLLGKSGENKSIVFSCVFPEDAFFPLSIFLIQGLRWVPNVTNTNRFLHFSFFSPSLIRLTHEFEL